jgi:squalene synthase HpnC
MGARGEIELGDLLCERLTGRHYENFWVCSPLVPAAIRPHLRRVYAFCRLTDDLGDESGDLAEARLELWRRDLERCFDGPVPPLHPALLALRETIAAHRLPAAPFFDLVEANLRDQRVGEYETWAELREYCRLSAAPVGRLVLRLFGLATPTLEAPSDDVCIGLQLANFAQDVSVDRQKGRTYLLQSELRAYGMAGAVRAMCERARRLLASGRLLEARVGGRLRLQLALYRLGGEAILRAIAADGYRTDLRRPRVPGSAKVGLLAIGGLQPFGRWNHVGTGRTAGAQLPAPTRAGRAVLRGDGPAGGQELLLGLHRPPEGQAHGDLRPVRLRPAGGRRGRSPGR